MPLKKGGEAVGKRLVGKKQVGSKKILFKKLKTLFLSGEQLNTYLS